MIMLFSTGLCIFLTSILVSAEKSFMYFEQASYVPAENQTRAVESLIKRLIPHKSNSFIVKVNPLLGVDGKDTFKLESSQGSQIKITGSSGVAAAWGFHHYMKYFCSCHISWSGNQLNIPEPLPVQGLPLTITSNDRFRYYQNVCTASYTMVWWNWTRWEQEIDWMALNGINLPLAFNAQEYIWNKVFLEFGFLQDDIDQFFTGPAFLAWNRMGNLQTWGGPLSQQWFISQNVLQHRILHRMREFGMMPVLPAFSGHVPETISRIYPNATTSVLQWGKFQPPYSMTFLEPQDPLFVKIGTAFLKEYIKEFGTNHFYNTDLFNEMRPNSSSPDYLKLCGLSVFKSLIAVDPDAIWVMQGWMFGHDKEFWQPPQAKALLTSVPIGKMIVLDLQSELNPQFERLQWYFGQPFIWCMLHNFGGVLGLYGVFDNVNEGPFQARHHPNSTMIGTGLTPEGIEQNYIIYDLMNEMSWRTEPVDLDQWIELYVKRRYGISSETLVQAWRLLKKSVYNASNDIQNHGKYIFIRRPSLKLKPLIWYDPKDVFDSWSKFISAATNNSVEPFRYDLVDVTRQSLQLIFDDLYLSAVAAFRKNTLSTLQRTSRVVISLLRDLDKLLATDRHFLLGRWLESAKMQAGNNEKEKILYEFNARNQITLWGPTGEVLDYGNKQWSGLISKYYLPRWQLFLSSLEESIRQGIPYNQTHYEYLVFEYYEKAFTFGRETFPSEPQGNPVIIAGELYKKYKGYAAKMKRVYKYLKTNVLLS